ncbi:MAG: hypothetical protein LAN18_16195 [Acidobacteriia bacterium]|nr:hypothetical protein [Terriglobia bacterium]
MDIKTDMYEGTTITLASGFGVRIPKLANAPNIIAQDVKNATTGLLELIGDLDKRLAALEKSTK